MKAVYRGRLGLLYWLLNGGLGAVAAYLVWRGIGMLPERPVDALVLIGGAAGMGVLVLAMAWPCRYSLESDHLLIRFGVMKQPILYRDITHVRPAFSLLAAPAWTLHRVAIGGKFGVQYVGPTDREGFVSALQARVDQVHRGDPASARA